MLQAARDRARRRRMSGLYAFHRSTQCARLPLPRLALSTHAPPLRCHGVALWRRSAQPTHSAPVGGTDAAEARDARAIGGRASAEIPVSQHCEGPKWAWPRSQRRSHGLPCRCHGSARLPLPRFAALGMWSPHATRSIAPRQGPCTGVPQPMPPSPESAMCARARSMALVAARPVRAMRVQPPCPPACIPSPPPAPTSLPAGDAGRLIPYAHAC